MSLQNWLSEEQIKIAAFIGVVVSGIFGGPRLFRFGQRRGKPEKDSAAAALHQELAALREEVAAHHKATQGALNTVTVELSYVKGRLE